MRLPRRLVVMVALAALTLTACTNEVSDGGGEGATGGTSAPQAEGVTGRPVKVGFSAPGADHGWLKAITDNARKAATPQARKTLYNAAYRVLRSDLPLIYLWYPVNRHGVTNNVKGVRLFGDGLIRAYFAEFK